MALRLDPDLVSAVDAYASRRGVKKVAVYEAALRAFLDLAKGGVPDLVQAASEAKGPPTGSRPTPAPSSSRGSVRSAPPAEAPRVKTRDELAFERQMAMNRRRGQ